MDRMSLANNSRWRRSRSWCLSLVMLFCSCSISVLLVTSDLGSSLMLLPQDKGNSVKNDLYRQHDSGPGALDIIKARGFIGEQYAITSKDNAPLSIYHIINPLADPKTLNRYPVLIFHGVIGDASQMLSHSDTSKPRKPVLGQVTYDPTDISLPFMLSNNNFDVYMCDARGTNLMNHRVADDMNLLMGQKYWNWSLDEQILYDLPTFIDFVLEQTHEDKLHYIGYSESTLFMFALLSTVSSYQNKLASYVALAPVSYINHISGSVLPLFAPAVLVPEEINGNYVPQLMTDTYATAIKQMCQLEPFARTMCLALTASYSGVGRNELSHGFMATNFKSTSIKSVRHFMQLYLHQRLGMYDHGIAGNVRMYGQPVPPRYDLSRIKLPTIILFRGSKDLLSDPLDQQRLVRELGVKPYLDFNYHGYSHMDFLIGKDIIFKINVPAAQAMFHLLKVQALPRGGSIFRNPAKLTLPVRYKPVRVALPDGTRQIAITSNLVNDLVNTVSESLTGTVTDVPYDIITGTLTPSLLKQPKNAMKG